MKHLVCVLVAILLIGSVSRAQFKKGDVEMQFNAGLGSYTDESKTSFGSSSQSESNTHKHADFYLCPGYYVIDGLSIELELGLFAQEKLKPAQSVLVEASYTYLIPQTSVAPFAHAGYGFSNMYSLPGAFVILGVGPMTDKLDIDVINLGAGVKFLISKHTAIVAELNYRGYTGSYSKALGSSLYSTNYTFSNIGLICGVSIIF